MKMAFQVSPGVNTSEIDLTTVVPGVSSVDAGFSGAFRWGPINDVTLIDSEDLLVQTFQKPDANTYLSFFTAANFLNYSNKLHLVRCANTTGAKNAASTSGGAILVANSSVYYNTLDEGGASVTDAKGNFMAKWAGGLGNSLKVSICGPTRANLASGNTVVASNSDVTLTGTVAVHVSDKSITGTNTLFGTELRVGDVIQLSSNTFVIATISSNTAATVTTNPATGAISAVACVRMKRSAFSEPSRNMLGTVAITANVATITATTAGAEQAACSLNLQYTAGDIVKINGEERRVKTVTNSSSMIVHTAFTNTATAQAHSRTWEYAGSFDKEPVTTDYTASRGGLYDEIHVAVVDEDGEWTGNQEEVLEAYTGVSVAKGAKFEDGGKAFYLDRINRRSKYIWWMDHNVAGDAYTTAGAAVVAWGAAAGASEWQSAGDIVTASMTGGVDGSDTTDGNKIEAYNYFKNSEEVEIGL
ncbi:MAG: hypothetical protein EX285_06265, partial [Thaumarchaeota archaeon]|nr:hypothetical protein [Nitrososphaerota archaeon]